MLSISHCSFSNASLQRWFVVCASPFERRVRSARHSMHLEVSGAAAETPSLRTIVHASWPASIVNQMLRRFIASPYIKL